MTVETGATRVPAPTVYHLPIACVLLTDDLDPSSPERGARFGNDQRCRGEAGDSLPRDQSRSLVPAPKSETREAERSGARGDRPQVGPQPPLWAA